MKNQVIKRLKKVLAATLTVSMLMGLGMVASARVYNESDSAVTGDKVVYEKRTDYASFMSAKDNEDRIPEAVTVDNNGLIFGGWFAKQDDNTYKPMESADDAGGKDVYAKFVPARVLSVKFQNPLDTTTNGGSLAGGATNVKVISSVDSLNYANVGFEMRVVSLSSDKKTYNDDIEMNVTGSGTTVYHQLKVNGNTIDPETLFGNEADYFATSWILNVPQANFDTILYVQPYWMTLDGTKVEGLAKYGHVNDAFGSPRKISVPINVTDIQGVAAGVVEIQAPEGVTVSGIECGRVFGEMDFADKGNGKVKLVGNLKSMEKDIQVNDIYANVIFEVEGSNNNTLISGKDFTVTYVDFANINEAQYTETQFPVWDIAY